MFHHTPHALTLAIAGSILLVGTAQTSAQNTGTVEEIKVTADFRNGSIDEIPASISVIDDALIDKQNARHLEEVLLNTPNINMAGGSSRARFFQIRGIGERGQFTEPLNPSVGILIDGIDFSGAGTASTLYDVEQVEVLMGPQGTRYGSNALAGLINIQTKAPTEELRYGAQLEAGNYDTQNVAGYVSGPLNDELSYRLSAQQLNSDGFSTNRYLGRPTNQRDETTVRARLRWEPSAETRVDFTSMFVDVDNGYDVFSLDNTRDTLADEPGFDRQRSTAFSVIAESQALSGADVELLLSYADSDIDYGYDEDWVYEGFHPDGYSATDNYFRQRNNVSAEFRLLSNERSELFGGRTEWVVGMFSLSKEVDLRREYTYLSDSFYSDYNIDRHAIYGETNTRLSSLFSVDLGLRAERFEADYRDDNALRFSPSDNLLGGKLALNLHTANDNLAYLSASRGYKTGGFNTDGSLDEDLREFDAEFVWNYELGFKGSFLNEQVHTRAALFYMDRDDVQISSSTLRPLPSGGTEFIDFTGNAAAGNNYGLELSADWQALDNLRIYGSLGLLESEYQDFVNSQGDDLDGREQAHAPSYQFSIGSDLWLRDDLQLSVNLQGRDAFYFSDSHNERSSSYAVVHASLNYNIDNWRLSLWGRNLSNEDYAIRGYYFGNDPRDNYTPRVFTQLGEPRNYGVRINYDF